MITYNDAIELSYLYGNNKLKDCIQFIYDKLECTDIIDFFHKLKKEKFTNTNQAIKLAYKTKELVVFEENFLTNIPEPKILTETVKEYTLTVSAPRIINGELLSNHCIHSLHYNNETLNLTTEEDYNLLPLQLAKGCEGKIKEIYSMFDNMYLFYLSKDYCSRFFLNQESIITAINYTFIDEPENMIKEQLFLMEKFNFNYRDFDYISFNKARKLLTTGVKILNDRHSSKTQTI